jgi:hypothetical protein
MVAELFISNVIDRWVHIINCWMVMNESKVYLPPRTVGHGAENAHGCIGQIWEPYRSAGKCREKNASFSLFFYPISPSRL